MPSIRDEIVEIIRYASRPHELDLSDENTPLLQLGLDSLDYSSVLMAVEDKFDLRIDEEHLEQLGSLREIVTFVEAHVGHASRFDG